MQLVTLIIIACLALSAAGCGIGSSDSTQTAGEKALEAVEREERAAAKEEKEAEAAREKETQEGLAELPKLHVPAGPPPKKLVIKDKKTGSGAVAKVGDRVSVHAVGLLYETKKPFEENWGNDLPVSFSLGSNEVIEGWEKGFVGMKVGGQRELIIPPGLAYGSQGAEQIPPDSTLFFLVELVKVK